MKRTSVYFSVRSTRLTLFPLFTLTSKSWRQFGPYLNMPTHRPYLPHYVLTCRLSLQAYVLLMFNIFSMFADFCQTNYLNIYRTILHEVCRLGRTLAVNERSEIDLRQILTISRTICSCRWIPTESPYPHSPEILHICTPHTVSFRYMHVFAISHLLCILSVVYAQYCVVNINYNLICTN